MASIKRPGVEVTQENVTAVTATTTPNLATVLVGPCFQIVDAFDDAGAVQSEALAGTYQDGKGTIAYALPSLKTGATVDSDSIRVFRVDGAGTSTELRDSDNEETIVSGTSGDYSQSGGTFTDTAAGFVASGVTKGDFVRVTYQGEVIDIEITGTVSSATVLTVDTPITYTGTLTFATYSIVRNPPQFVYKSAAEQADVEFPLSSSPETNYLHVAIKSTAASALTGASGDGFKMQLKETDPDYSITYAATGTGVITATGIGTDLTSQGLAVGPLSDTSGVGSAVVFSHATAVLGSNTTSGNTLEGIVDADTVVLDVHLGAAITSSSEVVVGKMLADTVGDGSSTTYTQSSKTLVFPSAHGIPNPPGDNTFVLLVKGGSGTGSGNDGLYKVASYSSATAVILDGTTNPGADMTVASDGKIQSFIGSDLTSVSSDGESGTLGTVYDYSTSSTLGTVLSGATGKSIVFGSDAMASAAYQAINTVSGRVITLTGNLGSPAAGTAVTNGASGKQALAVETTATTNFVEPSGSSVTYQIELPRTDGQSIVAIATLASDLDGDSTFSANFDATANGSGNVTYAEVTTVDFDGGVDADNILVDEDLIGSTTATHSIYVSYKALRVDVSDQASSPALVEINTTTDVTNLLGKISTDNPLALAAYFATLQSPSTTVKCLGVSATSTAEPAGTTAAYSSALTYLEGQDVYSLACLSTDPAIQALFETHVTSMSAAENKSERIAFVSQDMPSYTPATLLSSGTAGNTGASFSSDYTFTTNVDFSLNATLTTVLADTASDDLILVVTARSSVTKAPTAANGVLPIKYGIRVDKASSSAASDRTTLVLNSTDVAAALVLDSTWTSMVDVTWSLFQMGSALSTTAQKATAVADLGSQFENKRVFLVWPDSANASISGSATVVGGEYLAAAWAAKVGFEKPEQAFTNTTLTGFSSLSNSNTLFSRSQLDAIAGGGVWITVQNTPSSALSCRHQLSTLVDTIQNRELSITKTVDHVAKRLRAVLEPKIGSFRITQSYLDSLGVIVEGELRNFVETGVLTSGKVNFVEVDDVDADTVNIQVIITVPFPANYIALTLQF
jgi:hypothetical protein